VTSADAGVVEDPENTGSDSGDDSGDDSGNELPGGGGDDQGGDDQLP